MGEASQPVENGVEKKTRYMRFLHVNFLDSRFEGFLLCRDDGNFQDSSCLGHKFGDSDHARHVLNVWPKRFLYVTAMMLMMVMLMLLMVMMMMVVV